MHRVIVGGRDIMQKKYRYMYTSMLLMLVGGLWRRARAT